MKKLIIIGILIILAISAGYAQTVIPPTTTVDAFASMKPGVYQFLSKGNTISIALDSQMTITTVKHDTIKIVVPCPPVVVCPPPIICPACPPIQKPRKIISMSWISGGAGNWLITFDDLSTQIF